MVSKNPSSFFLNANTSSFVLPNIHREWKIPTTLCKVTLNANTELNDALEKLTAWKSYVRDPRKSTGTNF